MYPPEQLFKPMSVDDLPYDIKISGDGIEPAKSQCDISKPTRPLTAYHVYFQLEREFIIQGSQCTDNDNNEIVKDTRPVGIELDPEMPLRYHNIHICRTWYTTGKEKRLKRKHRKTHGKIAFLDLSKTIAARWATLEETDPETKNYCNKIAKRELEVYKEKVKVCVISEIVCIIYLRGLVLQLLIFYRCTKQALLTILSAVYQVLSHRVHLLRRLSIFLH